MTERLRVMTWNIRSAAGGDDAGPVVDRVAQLDRIAEVIDAAGVDIVGLQEVDRFWRRSGGVEQGREIATRVGMDAAFAPNWLPEGASPRTECRSTASPLSVAGPFARRATSVTVPRPVGSRAAVS